MKLEHRIGLGLTVIGAAGFFSVGEDWVAGLILFAMMVIGLVTLVVAE
jgi:hypothetical protein